jgi:hypothetical protein
MGAKRGRCHPGLLKSTIGVLWDVHLLDLSSILFLPPPIQGAQELVNISKRKADADSPVLVP